MKYKNAHSFFAILLAFVTAITSCGCSFFAKDNPEDILAAFKDGTVFCETYNNLCKDKDLKMVFTSELEINSSYILQNFTSRNEVCKVNMHKRLVPNGSAFVSVTSQELGPDSNSDLSKCAIILHSMFSGKRNYSARKKEFSAWMEKALEQAICNVEYEEGATFTYNHGELEVMLYRGSDYTNIGFLFSVEQESPEVSE